MKTKAITEAGSSPPGENEHWSQQWRRNTSCAEEKPVADWKNNLQIQGEGRKSPTPVLGIKPYGNYQAYGYGTDFNVSFNLGGVDKRNVHIHGKC